jgi:hypothetical protein
MRWYAIIAGQNTFIYAQSLSSGGVRGGFTARVLGSFRLAAAAEPAQLAGKMLLVGVQPVKPSGE